MQSVIETADYIADAKAAGMSPEDRAAVVDHLAANPKAGDVMVGTGGARKVRFRRPGTGKSGGYRVMSYFGGKDIPVFLLAVFAKGDRDNLTQAERNELRVALADLASDYREGVKR
jgi:hypothetical protein